MGRLWRAFGASLKDPGSCEAGGVQDGELCQFPERFDHWKPKIGPLPHGGEPHRPTGGLQMFHTAKHRPGSLEPSQFREVSPALDLPLPLPSK